MDRGNLSAVPDARGEVAAAQVNGIVYLVGQQTAKTYAYTIATDTWVSNLAQRPLSGNHHAMVSPGAVTARSARGWWAALAAAPRARCACCISCVYKRLLANDFIATFKMHHCARGGALLEMVLRQDPPSPLAPSTVFISSPSPLLPI